MSSLAAQLASLLSTVRRPGDFFAAGTTELPVPSVEVEGVGPVALPLLPMQAAQLMAAAEVAPYGRGDQTLIDPTVRLCSQIDPDRVRLGGKHWTRTLDGIVAEAVKSLGVSDTAAAEFYKLLIYGPGGFFVGHRDTEKADGMFATLVVVLPSTHTGGELVVRHKGREVRLDLRRQDPGEVGFAAFYADCVHELLPVISQTARLQRDPAMPVAELAERVGLSPSPCWRRVQRLTEEGVIRERVALLDAERIGVGVGVNVFVSVRTNQHKKAWAGAFTACVMALPEVVGFYRMAGDIDCLLHVVVPDIAACDQVYKRLIERIELYDVSASFAIETIKSTTALPLNYVK